MGILTVDFAALDSLSTAIERTIDQTEAALTTLTSTITHLTQTWTGSAADGFQHTVADWMAGQHDLRRRLDDLRALVVTAHDNHTHAVHVNTAMWRV